MKFNSEIHGKGLLVKSLLGRMIKTSVPAKNTLTVLAYHHTPKIYTDLFRDQLNYLLEIYEIISAKQLGMFYKGQLKYEKPLLLITFDDGIQSNRYAADLLNELGLKALFFVIPGFINTVKSEQQNFLFTNVYPKPNLKLFPEKADRLALSWQELRNMIKMGHSVGVHSYTHLLRANTSDQDSLNKEILESKKEIENQISSDAIGFCSPVNSILSVGLKELELIKQNYKYFFSTHPGTNNIGDNPLYIKRINVEVNWPFNAFKFALSKFERRRFRYDKKVFLSYFDTLELNSSKN